MDSGPSEYILNRLYFSANTKDVLPINVELVSKSPAKACRKGIVYIIVGGSMMLGSAAYYLLHLKTNLMSLSKSHSLKTATKNEKVLFTLLNIRTWNQAFRLIKKPNSDELLVAQIKIRRQKKTLSYSENGFMNRAQFFQSWLEEPLKLTVKL